MRRTTAGGGLRERLVSTIGAGILGLGIALGLLLASLIQMMLQGSALAPYQLQVMQATALILTVVFSVTFVSRWRLGKNLEKGFKGEVRVGQGIEGAITAPGCAVAHSVTGIGIGGEIDHLVATPGKLWVIETKVSRIKSRKRFSRALEQTARNTRAARRWAGRGTNVQGCLVLAFGHVGRKWYDVGAERLAVVTRAEMITTLRLAAAVPVQRGDKLAKRVWRAGKDRR